MRLPIVAGNWKMHGGLIANHDLLESLKSKLLGENTAKCIIFPPFVYLQQIRDSLQHTAIAWGAQNVCQYTTGAYTGEISAQMLQDLGCRYVLVGHSERRVIFNESDSEVALKFILAQQQGVTPILCVGETLEQRQQDLTEVVISKQLDLILNLQNGVQCFNNAIVAYEPVWAIGTGVTATPEQAQAVHELIRRKIASKNEQVATQLSILYGGSVKANNAAALFAMPDIDGALVGGAALIVDEFVEIIRCIS